jgi:hypothetical protein
MLSELIFVNATLSRWLKTPAAPICEISLHMRDECARPYSREEIRAMRDTMKRLSWQSYIRVFYNEGQFVYPPAAWPHSFHPLSMKTLACLPRPRGDGRAKVNNPWLKPGAKLHNFAQLTVLVATKTFSYSSLPSLKSL